MDKNAQQVNSPMTILQKGLDILNPLMNAHGFHSEILDEGKGSGGLFVACAFARENRRLEFHVRFSVGLVAYYIDNHCLNHNDYMRLLDKKDQSQYPGFSDSPIDAFHHLHHDLANFCSDFLTGDGLEFKMLADKFIANPNMFNKLP